LSLLAKLLGEHVLLPLHGGWIEPRRIDRLRIGRRHVHRDEAPEGREFVALAGALEADQHADLAETVGHGIMDIAADRTLADFEFALPTQRHVLADGRNRVRPAMFDGDP